MSDNNYDRELMSLWTRCRGHLDRNEPEKFEEAFVALRNAIRAGNAYYAMLCEAERTIAQIRDLAIAADR